MDKRVGQHCSVILEITRQFSRKSPDRGIEIRNVPRYADVVKNGAGHYFHNPAQADKTNVYFN
jgi:hypothetical protein